MKTRSYIKLWINGIAYEVPGHQASQMLADFLRYETRQIGTKIVCAEGDCGACSVLRTFPLTSQKPVFEPINSCITTVSQMDGSSLITVDALASPTTAQMIPAQEAMMNHHGSQCGFCTPGFVVALAGMMEKKCAQKADK